jgi:hypothetical protein
MTSSAFSWPVVFAIFDRLDNNGQLILTENNNTKTERREMTINSNFLETNFSHVFTVTALTSFWLVLQALENNGLYKLLLIILKDC